MRWTPVLVRASTRACQCSRLPVILHYFRHSFSLLSSISLCASSSFLSVLLHHFSLRTFHLLSLHVFIVSALTLSCFNSGAARPSKRTSTGRKRSESRTRPLLSMQELQSKLAQISTTVFTEGPTQQCKVRTTLVHKHFAAEASVCRVQWVPALSGKFCSYPALSNSCIDGPVK